MVGLLKLLTAFILTCVLLPIKEYPVVSSAEDMYSSLAQTRGKALMKTCTGGQEGPSHGLTPRKETAGATHTHTLKRLR